jgi:KAP family P-loop domain
MSNQSTTTTLRPDTSDSHEDELNLRPFVAQIASAIASGDGSEAWVVSIEAPWGRGKTWCLEELKRQLQTHFNRMHRAEDFNPWLLSDHRQIVQSLLRKIQIWVSDSTITALKEIGADIREFAGALGGANGLADHVGLGFSLGPVLGALAKLPSDGGSKANPEKLKANVVKALKDADTRLFVFIDDLDRVTPDEFVATIRAIKAVADFPHVTYVLAFDSEIADQQLKNAGIARGGEFLDKIIQLRAPLPPFTKQQKRLLLDKALNALPTYARQNTPTQSYASRITKLFRSGLADTLRTPRDIKRIVNRLLLLPEQVFRDVNVADLFALATIEIVDAKMFSALVANAPSFVSNEIAHKTDLEELKRLNAKVQDETQAHQEYLQKLVDENAKLATKRLLHELFPQIWSTAASQNAPFDLLAGHLSHERNFFAALQGMLPEGSVPIHAIRELLRKANAGFESALDTQLTTHSLNKIIDGLACVLPYERPDERASIWEVLTHRVRANAIEREANSTSFATSLANALIWTIYKTERFAISNERGDLLPFSFRNWVAENLSEASHLMFWPTVFSVFNKEGDRPIASGDAWEQPYEPAKWDAELLSLLIAGKEDFFESGNFLDEPGSGELLTKMAEVCSRRYEEIVKRLLLSDENFDRLAFRIVYAYARSGDAGRKCYVSFHTEHPLRASVPDLVSRAAERLQASNISRCVRLACTAIANGHAEIPSDCFSDPSEI